MKKLFSLPILFALLFVVAAPVGAAPAYQTPRTMTITSIETKDAGGTPMSDPSNTLTCAENGKGGIRCDFHMDTRSPNPWYQYLQSRVSWIDSAGGGWQEYYYLVSADATGGFAYTHPVIEYLIGAGVFSTGTNPSIGQGKITVSGKGSANSFARLLSSEATGYETLFEGYFIISPTPIDEGCEADYLQLTQDIYEIIPTVELPLGPAGTPPDDQIYTTVIDQIYRVEIDGGPWSDGTNGNRKDVAISWDGVTWTPLVQVPTECATQDASGSLKVSYIIAESETFYIRVNDSPGAFANNTNNPDPMTYSIGISVLQAAPSCESQFTYDEQQDWVASVQVHGDDQDGVLATSELVAGDWYAIVVANGSWKDGGTGPDRYDMDYYNGPSEFTLMSIPYTDLAGGNQNTWCQSEDGMSAFIQAKDVKLYLRVNDTSFAGNTGVLGVNIFHSSFIRNEQTCEMQFERGSLVSSDSVQANQEGGKVFAFSLGTSEVNYDGGLIPGAWYYLETTGGPWQWKGAGHSASGISHDMAVDDGDGFGSLLEWAGAECVVELDALGHVGAYFQIPDAADVQWKLRVDDDANWFNNSGSMGWNLYGASDLGIVPTDECDYIYDPDHPVAGDWVDAKSENGEWMAMYSGNIYAIVLNGSQYYWSETAGGAQLRDMQISNDDGQTWGDLPAGFGGVLCYMQNGNDTTLFVRVGQGQTWKMRVDSTTFADNYGGMGYQIFAANAGDTLDPWTNCFDGNVANILNSLAFIPVKEEQGVYINGTNILAGGDEIQILQPTETYKVQIEEGPWNNGEGGNSYNADISSDNGVTWYAIDDRDNPDIICADTDFAGFHKSVYFTVQEGQRWKIRVGDSPGEFVDNGGNLGYSLYSMAGADVPPVDVSIPPAVINNVCNAPLVRPTSILEVARWVEYARQGMQRYFAWCPGHTDILMAMFNALKAKEPIATITELFGTLQSIRSEAGAYNWGPSSGQDFSILNKPPGQSYTMFEQHFSPALGDNNPWDGGLVDLEGSPAMPSSYNSCREYLAPQAGSWLAQGVCYASAMMLETGASFWIQILLDIGIGFLCLQAFLNAVKDAIAMATGVTLINKM